MTAVQRSAIPAVTGNRGDTGRHDVTQARQVDTGRHNVTQVRHVDTDETGSCCLLPNEPPTTLIRTKQGFTDNGWMDN